MTREDAIYLLKNTAWLSPSLAPVDEAIGMAIEALEEQPRPINPTVEVDLASGSVPRSALNRVTNPPKVTIHVDRPKGHWILSQNQDKEDTDNGNYRFECSNCGCSDTHSKATEVPYCWHCGADMRQNLVGKHADVTIIDEACMKGADDE